MLTGKAPQVNTTVPGVVAVIGVASAVNRCVLPPAKISAVVMTVPLSVIEEFVGQTPAPPPFVSTFEVSAPEEASVPVAV